MKDETPYSRAAAVARFIDLRDVHMLRVEAELDIDLKDVRAAQPWGLSVERSVSSRFNDETRAVIVDATLVVEATAADLDGADESDATHPRVFGISSTFRLTYHLRESKGEPEREQMREHIDAFGRVNGIFNAWPYFREIVHTTLGRMGITQVVLPVYRVSDDKELRETHGPDGDSTARD